jgi:hypothetical protein
MQNSNLGDIIAMAQYRTSLQLTGVGGGIGN